MYNTSLTIGKLAQTAGVNIETIRYYQKIGLLQKPEKPQSGYRQYPENNVQTIHFIKRSQKLGFNLAEVGELLSLGKNNCSDVQNCAKQKRSQIQIQIEELKGLQNTLDTLIDSCRADSQCCTIISTLSKD